MRGVAKGFIIFSMIVAVLPSLVLLPFFSSTIGLHWFGSLAVLLVIGGAVLNIGIGFWALNELKGRGKPSIGVSIVTLIFCNIISGILMLCMPDESSSAFFPYEMDNYCESCGQRKSNANIYKIITNIGVIDYRLCNNCKGLAISPMQRCVNCHLINSNVIKYAVNTEKGMRILPLCDMCKTRFDIMERQ